MSILLRKHIGQIVSLTDAEFEQVLSCFTPKKMKRYQFVVQEGQYVEHEYFVLDGLLKAYYTSGEGKEHIIQFAMEDWWISDYQAYFNQGKATFNIDCVEETNLLSISRSDKDALCAKLHKMEHFFRIKTQTGYTGLQRRILSFLNNDAKTRYKELLDRYPALARRVPKTLIASYLGVSRETLSRFPTP